MRRLLQESSGCSDQAWLELSFRLQAVICKRNVCLAGIVPQGATASKWTLKRYTNYGLRVLQTRFVLMGSCVL